MGEDPSQSGGAGRLARQGPLREVYRCRIWCTGRLGGCALGRSRTPSWNGSAPRELARIGSNLNQIAHWANTHKENAEVLEVAAHLVAIERTLDTLTASGEPR